MRLDCERLDCERMTLGISKNAASSRGQQCLFTDEPESPAQLTSPTGQHRRLHARAVYSTGVLPNNPTAGAAAPNQQRRRVARVSPTVFVTLLGHADTVQRLRRGETPEAIVQSWEPELALFREMRARYLLYR